MSDFRQFSRDEAGASGAEYALILALVAIAIIGGLVLLGTDLNDVFSVMGLVIGSVGGGKT
jgi:pilus assembly protein Flp/PilA